MSKKEAAPKETHSPLPWREGAGTIIDARGNVVTWDCLDDDRHLIVRAVNRTTAFEAMVEAFGGHCFDCSHNGYKRHQGVCQYADAERAALALAQDSKGGEGH